MPSYKLTYFNGKGRGELSRLIFAAAGVKYEDKRIEFADWPAMKDSTPQGSMPILEVDGEKIVQSQAIARFLAREFKLYGKTNFENAIVDQILDTCLDIFTPAVKLRFMKDEAEQAAGMKEYIETTAPKLLGYLVDLMKQTGKNGFAVGNSLTMADLVIFSMNELAVEPLSTTVKADNPFDKVSQLAETKKMVMALPKVKAYLDKRPQTAF